MSSTEYVKNIRLLTLIAACKKQSRSHNRLPFGPNDTDILLDTDTVESRNRARMFSGVGDLLEANELGKLGITDKDHTLTNADLYENKINDIQLELTTQININSAMMTERATALAAMGAFVSDDIAEKAHTVAEQLRDVQAELQDLLQITNPILDTLTVGDDDGRPVDLICSFLRDCEEGELNSHNIDKIRTVMEHLITLLDQSKESPTLKKLNFDRYDSLLSP